MDYEDEKIKMILFKKEEYKVHVGEYFYIDKQELAPYDKEGRRVPMIVGSSIKLLFDVINKKWVYKKGTRYYNLLPINGKYIDHTKPLKNNHSSNTRYQIPSHFDRRIKSMNMMLEKKEMRLKIKEDKLNSKEMKIERFKKQLAGLSKNPDKLFAKLGI